MNCERFTAEDVTYVTRKLSNWKAPGPDGLHNFWIKHLPAAHALFAKCFSEALSDREGIPTHLTEGNTYLLYKKGDASDPKNYRPITCLSVVYKLFTALISNKIYEHCASYNLIEEEHKGCIRGELGCKQQLIIDSVVLKHAREKKRNISMGYIDYSKAFDSTPHDWMVEILNIYGVAPNIVGCLGEIMGSWRANLHLGSTNIGLITISRGIFQGDALWPLWFCLEPVVDTT